MQCGLPPLIDAVIESYTDLCTRCECTLCGSDLPTNLSTWCGDGTGLVREIYAGCKALIARCYTIVDVPSIDPGYPDSCLTGAYLAALRFYLDSLGCRNACRVSVTEAAYSRDAAHSFWFSEGRVFPAGNYKIIFVGGGCFRWYWPQIPYDGGVSDWTSFIFDAQSITSQPNINRFYASWTTGGITVRDMGLSAGDHFGDATGYTGNTFYGVGSDEALLYSSAMASWIGSYIEITLSTPGRIGIGAKQWVWNSLNDPYLQMSLYGSPIFELEPCLPCDQAEPSSCYYLRGWPNSSITWTDNLCATHYDYMHKELPTGEDCDADNWCDSNTLTASNADVSGRVDNDFSNEIDLGSSLSFDGYYCFRVNSVQILAEATDENGLDVNASEEIVEGCQICAESIPCTPLAVVNYGYDQDNALCPLENFVYFDAADNCYAYFKIYYKAIDEGESCSSDLSTDPDATSITVYTDSDYPLILDSGFYCFEIVTHIEDRSATTGTWQEEVLCCQCSPYAVLGAYPWDGQSVNGYQFWSYGYRCGVKGTFEISRSFTATQPYSDPPVPYPIVYTEEHDLTYSPDLQSKFFGYGPSGLATGYWQWRICVENDCGEIDCTATREFYKGWGNEQGCFDSVLARWTTLDGYVSGTTRDMDLRMYKYSGAGHASWTILETSYNNLYGSGVIDPSSGELVGLPDFFHAQTFDYIGYIELKIWC